MSKKHPDIVTKLYGGEIELIFATGRHRYTVGGEPVPSVTGITGIIDKPALVGWAANQCGEYLRQMLPLGHELDEDEVAAFAEKMRKEWRQVADRAASIGTLVHDYAEKYARFRLMQGPEPERPTEGPTEKGVDAFHRWVEAHHVEFIHAERKVYSRKHRYAGTVDLVAKIDGTLTIADYKTSKAWYPESALQVSAYRAALEEELGLGIERSAGLLFGKESGEFTAIPLDGHERDFEVFLACLEVKRWQMAK